MQMPVVLTMSAALFSAMLGPGTPTARGSGCDDGSFPKAIVCSGLGADSSGHAISAVFMVASDRRGNLSGIEKFWNGSTEVTIPFAGTYTIDPTCLGVATTTIGTFTFGVAKDKSVKFQGTNPGFVLSGDCQESK